MTERTINAGDWLEHAHYGRVRVAGFDEDGDPVFAIDRGTQYQCDLRSYFLASTRPLPGCDGWDWVEPVKPFVPRYFVPVGPPPWGSTERYVYVSDKDGRIDCVYSDGRRKRQDIRVEKMAADARTWREIWESDAKAILMPQPVYELSDLSPECKDQLREIVPEPLSTCPDCGEFRGHGHEDVCPMAWVTQDQGDVRAGIDQVRWSVWMDNERWVHAAGDWSERRHGFCDTGGGGTLSVRCRRRDLPPVTLQSVSASPFGDAMQPLANRVPVRLFVPRRVLDEPAVDYPVRCCLSQSEIRDVATWVEVKHDQNGLFLERET